MENTRIGTGERKKYTKAAYKKAGGNRMEEGWLLRIMGLWTAEVILISSSCIRLAKNTINGYGSPRVSAGGKRVELSLRLRKLFRIKKKRQKNKGK